MIDASPTRNQAATAIQTPPFSMDSRDFKLFRELIHRQTGIWLRDGKQVMLASRLSRRLRCHRLSSFADYYSLVAKTDDGGGEMRELINCVTTNKTSFFRERHHFDFLRNTVVPEARRAASRGTGQRMRVWSAACSTGEEPYSIVISLLEALGQASPVSRLSGSASEARQMGLPPISAAPGGWEIEALASDIDTEVLAAAARGIYPEESLESVDDALRRRYFLRGKGDMLGSVRIKKEVARRVQFKRINLMDSIWPVDGLFDAIFFRNALIYFNRDTQDIFLRKMLRHLKPNGHLFLGHSEHISWLHDLVSPLNQTIYQLRADGR